MTSNPYAPPSVSVNDVQPQLPSLERPAAVDRACTLLWCSTGLSILGLAAENIVSVRKSTIASDLFGLLFGVLLTVWFTMKLKRGRNWMRLLLTIVTALGVLCLSLLLLVPRQLFMQVYMAAYAGQPALVTINIAVGVAQFALNLSTIVLINMRAAKGWFHAVRDRGYNAA